MGADAVMKTCKVCGERKQLSEFPTNRQMIDGRRNECKSCTKRFVFEWRQRNVERLHEKGRIYAAQPHVRAATYKRTEAWRKENRDKTKVHRQLHAALSAGLVKPQPCWVCGKHAEAHHPDYSTPLDVVWLCKPHHKQAHALIPTKTRTR